jgi:hypothetical protein
VRWPNISHFLAPQAGGVEPCGNRRVAAAAAVQPSRGNRQTDRQTPCRPDDIKSPSSVRQEVKVVIIISRYKRVTALLCAADYCRHPCRPWLFLFFVSQGVLRPSICFFFPSNHDHPDSLCSSTKESGCGRARFEWCRCVAARRWRGKGCAMFGIIC